MYERAKSRWFKHFDFLLLDLVVIELTYLLVCYLRMKNSWYLFTNLYQNMRFYVVLFDFLLICMIPVHKNILKRKAHQELWESVKNISLLLVGMILYLYFVQQSYYFSRSIFTVFWVLGSLFLWMERSLYKVFVRKQLLKKGKLPQMLLVTSSDKMQEMAAKIERHSENRFTLRSVVLTDFTKGMEDTLLNPDSAETAQKEKDWQIIGGCREMYEYLRDHVIDEVMLDVSDSRLEKKLIQDLAVTGVTIHINLERGIFEELPNQVIERVGGFNVMTSSVRMASPLQLLLKRIMDIAGSLVGLAITAIAVIIFGPIIYIQSPGPIFYSQWRVGKSGRKFRIYKFRSMYPDADKRKAELMAQNKMDGLMFKMDDDPRIIPIGRMMRKFSIDELPQFYNILKGDMSLVGTRPPTVDEWEQYSPHHRARLCAKPGLTGMWQISGRSDITDFEEVVALDLKYIREWSIWLDIRMLFKTVWVVFAGKGSV